MSDYIIFGKEDAFIKEASKYDRNQDLSKEEILNQYHILLENHKKIFKQFKTLTAISDKQQSTLHENTNKQELMDTELYHMNQALEKKNQALIQSQNEKEAADKLQIKHAKLLQHDKMASIGLLSTGIAHEINTPAAFVVSNIHTLKRYVNHMITFISESQFILNEITNDNIEASINKISKLKKDKKINGIIDDACTLLDDTDCGLDQIKSIVSHLKNFARSEPEKTRKSTDINKCLEETLSIVWFELKHKVKLTRKFGTLPLIFIHPQQIKQVFVNLLVNGKYSVTPYL